jgi:hypothetical protein
MVREFLVGLVTANDEAASCMVAAVALCVEHASDPVGKFGVAFVVLVAEVVAVPAVIAVVVVIAAKFLIVIVAAKDQLSVMLEIEGVAPMVPRIGFVEMATKGYGVV